MLTAVSRSDRAYPAPNKNYTDLDTYSAVETTFHRCLQTNLNRQIYLSVDKDRLGMFYVRVDHTRPLYDQLRDSFHSTETIHKLTVCDELSN